LLAGISGLVSYLRNLRKPMPQNDWEILAEEQELDEIICSPRISEHNKSLTENDAEEWVANEEALKAISAVTEVV